MKMSTKSRQDLQLKSVDEQRQTKKGEEQKPQEKLIHTSNHESEGCTSSLYTCSTRKIGAAFQ